MSQLELFSARGCPFAHRTRLVLREKGVPFTHVEIDLANKPAWFREVSLTLKVPALRHETFAISESAVINEYLEEIFPQPPLLPADPMRRARARFWIEFANARLAPAFAGLLRGESGSRAAWESAVDILEAETLSQSAGPYLLGEEVSLVDYSVYPWFERMPALTHHRSWSLPARSRLPAWIEAVAGREAVRAIASPPEYYIERYARFVPVALAG